jgi:hypothetical protein
MSQTPHQRPRADSVVDAASEGYSAQRAPLRADDGRSIGEVMSDIAEKLSTLLRQEVTLAKAEVRESGTRAGKGVGLLAGAGVAALLLLIFISISAWWGLGQFMGNEWSALIVAAVWAVIALILGLAGRAELKRIRGVPRTTETLREIPNAMKGNEEENR